MLGLRQRRWTFGNGACCMFVDELDAQLQPPVFQPRSAKEEARRREVRELRVELAAARRDTAEARLGIQARDDCIERLGVSYRKQVEQKEAGAKQLRKARREIGRLSLRLAELGPLSGSFSPASTASASSFGPTSPRPSPRPGLSRRWSVQEGGVPGSPPPARALTQQPQVADPEGEGEEEDDSSHVRRIGLFSGPLEAAVAAAASPGLSPAAEGSPVPACASLKRRVTICEGQLRVSCPEEAEEGSGA